MLRCAGGRWWVGRLGRPGRLGGRLKWRIAGDARPPFPDRARRRRPGIRANLFGLRALRWGPWAHPGHSPPTKSRGSENPWRPRRRLRVAQRERPPLQRTGPVSSPARRPFGPPEYRAHRALGFEGRKMHFPPSTQAQAARHIFRRRSSNGHLADSLAQFGVTLYTRMALS